MIIFFVTEREGRQSRRPLTLSDIMEVPVFAPSLKGKDSKLSTHSNVELYVLHK